ncbi:putative sporulation-specific protein 15-like [Capsicum annuum]|nr:GDSL esterase/lipase At3g48460 [Capsicum annuum]KAF3624650.1 putative sporulation-specific protein 15-like [Capsicum annuum]KAF3628643.1 putative sporulation-specific protein 15-like [Capsicum annuum]
MSKMFIPHFPLTLFFCFCLFFSFSYAHYKEHETLHCDCSCCSAHNNSHENIPTKPGHSPPAHNKSQEIPTKPVHFSPAHNSQEIPTKPGHSSQAHNSSKDIPTKPGHSSPAQNNGREIPTKPRHSSPAHNNSQEIPTKPGNSSPAHNNSQEVPTKPGNSSPVHDNSQEVPTKQGNSFPAHNSSNEIPTKPGNSLPVQNDNPEVPANPGNSSRANNSSHGTSTRHNNFIGCFNKVYAFGDSYTDAGNANLVGGLNENFAHSSSTSEKSNNGLCDGHLVVDFLCDAFKLPHLPPFQSSSANFTNGANFAIAGSTILPKEDFSTKKITNLFWKGIPLTFQTQIDWFNTLKQQMGRNNCKAELENALFWIGSVGVSDYARIQGSSLSTHWLTQQSVLQVSRLIEAALGSGAKYIVVQGLPPIGCLPLHISLCPVKAALDHMGCAAAVNTAVMIHNQILQRRLERFRKLYPNCQILYADFWNAYLTIKMNHKKYQFEEDFKPCCGAAGGPLNFNLNSLCGSPGTVKCNDPSKYISWDGIHLTEAMNRKVTDLFLNQGFCQPSFSELVKRKSGM